MSEFISSPRPRGYLSRTFLGIAALLSAGSACGGEDAEAAAATINITPVTQVHEWPLETHERKPSSDYVHVKNIDDSGMDCSLNMEGELDCEWESDTDYQGFTRNSNPVNSRRGESQSLNGVYVTLNGSPHIDMPQNDSQTMYTLEKFYNLEFEYFTPSSIAVQRCISQVSALTFGNGNVEQLLEATSVKEVEKYSGKSIQFVDVEGQPFMSFGCIE